MEHNISPIGIGNEGRQVFWNAESFEPFLFLFTAVALAIFAYGVWRRWKMWKAIGKEEIRWDQIPERLKSLLMNGLLQVRTWKDAYPGIMHGLIFFGFFVLIFGAAFDAGEFHITEPLFSWAFLRGSFYLGFSFLMDLFGLFVLIGVLMAAFRRYIQKPDRLGYKGQSDNQADDAIALLLIGGIIVTGFIIEALRIHATLMEGIGPDSVTPNWEKVSFVGWSIASAFNGMDVETTKLWHKISWWTHTFIALGFIAYIPYSRLLHIITTPANHFLASLKPTGYVEPIRDFENAESFGVSKLEEFTWKQIFDSDACTKCGRCQNGCPAYLTGKHLSPKKLIQDIKTHWEEKAAAAMAKPAADASQAAEAAPAETAEGAATEKALIGDVVDLNAVWDCTNCMYCMENCPAMIEHVQKIIDMRRYKVLTEADFAPELQLTYRNMENNSNPWGIGAHMRGDWAKDLGIKTLAEDPNVEYLFYVGCSGSFDDRGKKISVAFAKVLQAAGVSFGILGNEESCCGDSAMRGGNDYLFQAQAQANIEVMNAYGVKKIITICPHGYNCIKKDYPNFGGNYEVYHHTEIIADLIAKGKIKFTQPVQGTFTYHDSCFLGRYNQVYDQPRNILTAISGVKLVEMSSNHAKSFCCGAGGARMWMEEHGDRINNARTDQAIAAGADTVAVGCPFCLTMISDGIKDRQKTESMVALDIAEIVCKAMGLEEVKEPVDVCAT
ncbi:MAG TPA: heterodisulfide reductase-related iron-sulfur binding cluster [Smithella sp.]|nr:heterodisulfide reductase-related iron-sulfur binding cluster [Smithella sp.]HRS96761.1 heterodisulfide reductase-related iron-sulfur binding cluster [Smithella sp.]